MLYLNKMLNLGNGEYSMAACYELHRRLERCLSENSAAQQYDPKACRNWKLLAKCFIKDALTGQLVEFKEG